MEQAHYIRNKYRREDKSWIGMIHGEYLGTRDQFRNRSELESYNPHSTSLNFHSKAPVPLMFNTP